MSEEQQERRANIISIVAICISLASMAFSVAIRMGLIQ